MDTPPVCNYEGSNYRTRFWEGQGRDYEDQVERIALRALMPPSGHSVIDIGAGYGRLADEFRQYRRIVLFDFSRSLLREAQHHLGQDPRFHFVAGNWYHMPFVNGVFNTLVQVRTIHHAADVPSLLSELARIGRPGGHYLLEFANKQNLKAIARYLTSNQTWSPFNQEPVEFAELNYDFHPTWMRQRLKEAGFRPLHQRTVSHFRISLLKRHIPTRLLVYLDAIAQHSGDLWQLSPSVFNLSQHPDTGDIASQNQLFACPSCKRPLSEPSSARFVCSCGLSWKVDDRFYDFKDPLNASA